MLHYHINDDTLNILTVGSDTFLIPINRNELGKSTPYARDEL